MRKKSSQPRELRILESLAQGIDPDTGEVLSDDSPFNQAETVRALYKAIRAIKTQWEQKPEPEDLPQRSGKPYTKEELQDIFDRFRRGQTLEQIAHKYERTVRAIEIQLQRLMLLEQQKQLMAENKK